MEIGHGHVVAGRYRLLAPLGRGGMAEVWRAEHVALRTTVALKLIDPSALTQTGTDERFLREARAAAALRSPHIVQVFDYGVDDGFPYMAMELLDGETLSARLARVGSLPFPDVVRVVDQVARAIGKAHEAGLVHRDLKPDNVFLARVDDDEIAKVLDFGIVKVTNRADLDRLSTARTVTGMMLGTPAYMSPEQTGDSDTVDHRSDLWSLGVIAFECVTGKRPFRGKGLGELLVQICASPIPTPSSVAVVPPHFDAWFARATERDVTRRFQSAREMSDELREIAVAASSDRAGVGPELQLRPSLVATPNNLPTEKTEFVGRRSELRRIGALIADSRLVTLTGPGGTGKTRLALHAAGDLLDEFPDGVYFVSLAAISDSRLVGSAILTSLGLVESPEQSALQAVADHLAFQQVLLVLDNLEQVTSAAPDLERLLDGAPSLRMLATSRIPLGLPRERVLAVSPLAVPTGDGPLDPKALRTVDGVVLFVCRAEAADPSFALTDANAASVARIVSRLEGLPLAIELAAAHIRRFTPEMLARRLDHGLELLRATTPDLPARHRTLRDTVAWSYGLLDDVERRTLRRLGVFAGSFSVEAVRDVVAGGAEEDASQRIASLINKSLVRREASSEERFSMLESIREFAEEELAKSGEVHDLRRRHLLHFLAVAEAAEPTLRRPGQEAAQRRLEADEANLRAALRCCLAVGDAESGLRIGGAIWRFWQSEGRLDEGRRWLSDFLDLPDASLPARAKGLIALAGLDYWQGSYATALDHYQAARDIYERTKDAFGVADTLFAMSTASSWGGDPVAGARLAEEALARFEAIGAREQVGMVRMAQGFARWMQGDLAGARPLWESSIAIAREVGDHVEAAHKRLALASITFQEGHERQAIDEALDAMEELREHANVPLTVMALDWIAALAVRHAPERCLRLAAAAAELRRTLGGGMRPEACGLVSARDVAARMLDPTTLDRLWREGMRMRLEEAVEYARGLRESLA